MHEHANAVWNIPRTGYTWDHVHLAVAMDIRAALQEVNREMRALNRVAYCRNLMNMPKTLKSIEKNTRKKKANANKPSDCSS